MTDGNVVQAAKQLGVSHRMLLRWIAAFDPLRAVVSEARETDD